MTNNLCLLVPPSHPPRYPKTEPGGGGREQKSPPKSHKALRPPSPRCLRRTESTARDASALPRGEAAPGFWGSSGCLQGRFCLSQGICRTPKPLWFIITAPGCVVQRDAILEDAGSRITKSQNSMGWKGSSKATQSNPSAINGTATRSGCSPWKCQKRDAVPGNARRGMLGAGCLERDHRSTE